MNSKSRSVGQGTSAALLAISVTFTWLGLSGGTVMADPPKGDTAAANPTAVPRAWESGRTQGGARVQFSSLKDWNVKGENLSPRGHNPLYFPLKPGFRYIMEYPDHPWGELYIEVQVLDKTEKFEIPGIGKFECAVVREEEFYDGVYDQQADNWFCIDKATNSMYAFGEVSWEIDQIGRKVFDGTWRVGEPDGNGMAEPGLLMPGGQFILGARYVFDGHEAEAYGYTENMESGLTVTVPAGTFENCVRAREYSLTNPSDVTDKWYCPGVGIVRDSSDGVLVASDALPGSDMASFGKYHRNPVKVVKAPVAKVDGVQATEIALKKKPGKANSIKIERLGKRNVYAVEILADEDGAEWDVFVDIETGEVVGTDS
jgi:Predicted membrane protein